MIADKKEYVLVVATKIPHATIQQIVLVERIKDDWQKGMLNLPGGSVEEGEAPEQAAVRELREETGLAGSLADTRILGTMEGHNWFVHVCLVPYRPWHPTEQRDQKPESQPGEGPVVYEFWNVLKDDPRLIPNLRIIVPLCQSFNSGWKLIPTSKAGDQHTWVVALDPVEAK